jgi:non-ribosomal peptide synthetase component F
VLAEKFAAELVPELEIILRYCEGYAEAKDFWVREFAKASAQMKIEIESDDRKMTGGGRASLTSEIEKSVLDRALLNFEANESQLLLAAYSILVSRLSGNEDLVLQCALDEDGMGSSFPLRLAPRWNSSFRLFVEQVKDRLRRAAALGQYAFDILSEEQLKHGWPDPILEVGYFFRQESTKKRVEWSATDLPSIRHSFNQDPGVVLEITECDGNITICFVYEQSRFSPETVKQFSKYLNVILEDAAADANIKLGDIEFEGDRKVYGVMGNLGEDVFNF